MTPDLDLDLDAIERTATDATRGPWTWTDHHIPDLEGRAGDPDAYEYSVTVLEASHWGECGCRSACNLELEISEADKAHIAAASPDVVIALIARLHAAEAALDRVREITPTWHRGMYGSPDDMISRTSLNRAIGTAQ